MATNSLCKECLSKCAPIAAVRKLLGVSAQVTTLAVLVTMLASCSAGSIVTGVGIALGHARDAMQAECLSTYSFGLTPADAGPIVLHSEILAALDPATWHVEQQDQSFVDWRSSAQGKLLITQSEVIFCLSSGDEIARFPVGAIWRVELRRWSGSGEPRAVAVDSCGSRIDVFSFPSKTDFGRLDPDAALRASMLIPTRFTRGR